MASRSGARALVLALTLSIAACSDASDDERAAAALKAEMVADAGMTTGRNLNGQQTSCVAQDMVEKLGVERLQDYELLTDDLRADRSIDGVRLAAEDADTLAQVFADCMDVEDLLEQQVIAGLELSGRKQQRVERCVRERVTDDDVKRTMSLEFQGAENPVFTQLRADLGACLR